MLIAGNANHGSLSQVQFEDDTNQDAPPAYTSSTEHGKPPTRTYGTLRLEIMDLSPPTG